MMLGKHGSINLKEDRTFQAKYMGCTSNTEPGVTGIDKAVKKIHDRIKNDEKTCSKITVEITKEGMTFIFVGSQKKQCFPIKDISYCSLNRFDTNIFAFNHHIAKSPLKVECHAVLCNSEEKARAIGQALYSSYREGHFEELRKERKKKLPTVTNQRNLKTDMAVDTKDKPIDSSKEKNTDFSEAKPGSSTAVLDTELDNIVQDMLNTVKRERENMEEQELTG